MQPKVAALIAYSGRFELLEHRALSSVRSQVRPPDVIVIVVDADHDQEGELEMKSLVKRVWVGSSVCPEVITLGSDLSLGHAEALAGAVPLPLGVLALAPAG